MRRATLTTGERADNLEQGKRLKKHVNECVRRANAALQEAGTTGALFSAPAVGVRAKLREACERVILMFPSSQDHQVEETLWRKVYYQPLHAAKEMRKGSSWSTVEAYWVCSHLWDGVAFYHSLLHSLAAHACLADFLPHQSSEEEDGSGHSVTGDSGSDTVARCLTCLGDLTRYMLDLPSAPPYHLSVRYYLQALHYVPDGGLIHSNLATVYSVNDQPLLAVAHYLRALTCEKIFEGAEGNLKRLLGKSRSYYGSGGEEQADHHKMFLHTVLTLTGCFISNRSTEEIARLCQDVLVQLGKALETYDDVDNEVPDRSPSPHTSANGHHAALQNGEDSPESTNENSVTTKVILTPEVMVIVCTVLSLCTKRLEKQGSSHTSMAQALMVSVLMTLISHVSSRLEQRISLIDPTCLSKLIPKDEKEIEEENKKGIETEETVDEGNSDLTIGNGSAKKTNQKKNQRTKRLANLRRRRLKVGGGGSGGSQDEDSYSDSSGSDEEDKDNEGEDVMSSEEEGEEELDLSQLCSSEDDDSDDDVKIESDQEWEGLTAGEHLELISKEGMLSAVYVACDWMKREEEIIQLCVKTANSLWTAIAKLLNLLRVDLEQLKNNSVGVRNDVISVFQEKDQSVESPQNKLEEALQKTPLPEDLMLHTLIPTFMSGTHKSLNLKTMEMILLRTRRLSDFGREMSTRKDTPLWWDTESGLYSFSLDHVVCEEKDKNKKDDLGITNQELSSSPTEEDMLSVPPSKRDSRRLAGMQSLTAQWLQHEVRSLEERTRRVTLGLYLVPDASVLINHLQAIQLLLSKPTHMIIIPQAVIGLLDQQKRDSLGARSAIRWLEIKFRHGSRFIRSQRPHERTHLPLIKYPKRKDKEAWEWYQIVECCNYLSAQVQQNSNNVKTATVTLLTGEKHLSSATFSHSGLTQAAGAVLEHIEEFMSKWQTSTKGHS